MPHVSERRRRPRRRPASEAEAAWVKLENLSGSLGVVHAKVVDTSDIAIGVEVPVALEENTFVLINGHAGVGSNGKIRARVVRCVKLKDGSFSAGLTYEENHHAAEQPIGNSEPVLDFYEVLQVNPKADPETIHRVFRMLAQRFHPDNGETGNAETFRTIMEAYKILSDPEKRAAYDLTLHSCRQVRWRIFNQSEAALGKRAESRKRQGILELLYTARMNQPTHPVMSIHELEDLLGCPREHLEFSLWYLKENALIVRSDNGRYSITAKGVDRAEEQDTGRFASDRLLEGRQDPIRA